MAEEIDTPYLERWRKAEAACRELSRGEPSGDRAKAYRLQNQ
ncbi:hypothetical protein MES5069_360160 [Mesorhizobium escarrei]|uniref:Uncharacterized protein n=2 Tax=Mesorhizobium escarrei TaxID=666018 RepID=A0ABN8JYL2_9HYPH|nr:hypothetical protein MES5069_360160 [Mesorhizobium escarrei]